MNIPNESPQTFEEIIDGILPLLDETLAREQVGVALRPFQAAIQLVSDVILEVEIDGISEVPSLENGSFASASWFRVLYQQVEEWYRRRYGVALDERRGRTAAGFVVMWGTPFMLEVPIAVVAPGTPGETIILQFPAAVLPEEDPTEWLVSPPNTAGMNRRDQLGLTRRCTEVANLLRSIESKLLGIGPNSDVGQGFIQAVRSHLRSAVEQVVENWVRQGTSKAAWEMQMACECALKALAYEKASSFRQTHDLFLLCDDASQFISGLKRSDIKRIPRWEEMVNLRYGQGVAPSPDESYKMFLATLRIVDAGITPLVSLELGRAEFEIARAPWRARSGEPQQ